MRSVIVVGVVVVVAAVVALVAAGCDSDCTFDGVKHKPGDIFPAPDGCNTCTCEQGTLVTCTALACAGEGEGEGTEGEGVAEGEGAEGEGEGGAVVPIPAIACSVFAQRGRDFDVDGGSSPDTLWTLERAPVGSHASLFTSTGPTTTLHADAFGLYVLRMEIDSAASDCFVRNIPTTGVAIELSWDVKTNDLDLHVTKADSDGNLCVTDVVDTAEVVAPFTADCSNASDCNWLTCSPGFGPTVDWDGPVSTAGEPAFVVVDVVGYGPEVITVDHPADGTYAAAIAGSVVEATTAWARLWIDGQLVAAHAAAIEANTAVVLPAFRFAIGGGEVCVDDLAGGPLLCTSTPSCDAPTDGCAQCTLAGDTDFDGIDDVADADGCGTGIHCDAQATVCVPDNAPLCADDDGCDDNASSTTCFLPTNTCMQPQCDDDVDCASEPPGPGGGNERDICTALHTCVSPPAVCSEVDEPNNAFADATAFEISTGYAGILCRGDVDLLTFDVVAGKRYTVIFTGSASGEDDGNTVELVSGDAVVAHDVLHSVGDPVAIVADAVAAGALFVRVTSLNSLIDESSYAVDVLETDTPQPASCTNPPEEPNDVAADATPLVIGTTASFARCGVDDVDFYRVTPSPLHGLSVTLADFSNFDGNLNVDAFVDDISHGVDSAFTADNSEHLVLPELPAGATEYLLKVTLPGTLGTEAPNEAYTLTTSEVPRPAACALDTTEPDGDPAHAVALTPDATGDFLRCNAEDVDDFRFTLPQGRGGDVVLHFEEAQPGLPEGDLALDLLDENGALLTTSDTSIIDVAQQTERVRLAPSDTDVVYFARVRLSEGRFGAEFVGQHYTIEVDTFDAAVCLASEPVNDDVFARGRCIGDFTPVGLSPPCVNDTARLTNPIEPGGLAACAAAADGAIVGCGRTCDGGDDDFYRAGVLVSEQVLRAVLDFDPADGALKLQGAGGPGTDNDHDGHIEAVFIAPRLGSNEVAVAVRPDTNFGGAHALERYALTIQIGPPCFRDDVDVNAGNLGIGNNEKPATATPIRPSPQAGVPSTFDSTSLSSSRCTNDVDVYELQAFAAEHVTVELVLDDTTTGTLNVELGTRPADLNNPAVVVAAAAANDGPVTFDNPTTQELYVTVRVAPGNVVTGPYALTVSTIP